jgi:predicted branched-subunit amino acid permease
MYSASRGTAATYRGADVARCWAGFASLGAGLVHAAVIRDHTGGHAVFFAAVAAGQLSWGLAALARDRMPAPRWVAGATLAVLAVWVISRTAGIPVGSPEDVGAADLGAAALELVVLVAGAVTRWGPRVRRGSTAGLLGGIAAGALLVGAITTPALAGTGAGERATPHGHHADASHGAAHHHAHGAG